MGDEDPVDSTNPSKTLKAADARVEAAKAEYDAALKFATDFAQFGGKGDAEADRILSEAGRRVERAHAELDNAESARANALLAAGQAARRAREASTPIDDLLMGATSGAKAGTPSSPPWTPPIDIGLVPGLMPEKSLESPQPNELERRPLPPDPEEPEPASNDRTTAPNPATQPVDTPAGTSRRAITAIAGLGIIGVGAIGAILLLNNGATAPGGSAGPPASNASDSAGGQTTAPAGTTPDIASVAPGSAAPGSGTFAGRWTIVSGLDDPSGLDVTSRWYAGNGPVIEALPAVAFFDIDASNAISGGEYHVGILTDDQCHPQIKVDGLPATGSVDVNGVGVVYWNATTITEEQCNSNTGGLTTTSGPDVPHWFQFRILGEQMILCRSSVTASMTDCAAPYPRRVALFQRTAT